MSRCRVCCLERSCVVAPWLCSVHRQEPAVPWESQPLQDVPWLLKDQLCSLAGCVSHCLLKTSALSLLVSRVRESLYDGIVCTAITRHTRFIYLSAAYLEYVLNCSVPRFAASSACASQVSEHARPGWRRLLHQRRYICRLATRPSPAGECYVRR